MARKPIHPKKKEATELPRDDRAHVSSTAKYSFEGLDRVMHEKARLSIMASLAAHDRGLLFGDLKQLCGLTDGNLNRHLAVLSEAELVEIWKNSNGQRPQTMVRLTADGRARFAEYISVLAKIVADAQVQRPVQTQRDLPGGWSPA